MTNQQNQNTQDQNDEQSGVYNQTGGPKINRETQNAGVGGIKTFLGERQDNETANAVGLTTGDDMGTASGTGEPA